MAFRIEPDLILRHDRPAPRYTSYPTAADFHRGFGAKDWATVLADADRERPEEPWSLYVHLPFCASMCLYCGCTAIATPRKDVVGIYLDHLEREIDLVAAKIPNRRSFRELHWGGGTPNFLNAGEIDRLFKAITAVFAPADDARIAIEMDPRTASEAQLRQLRDLGFHRVSFGVQDLNPEVQELVARVQPEEKVARLLECAQRLGFDSVNVDLMYGLPAQTAETFQTTVKRIIELGPDRIALFSYAHVPWLKGHQKRLPIDRLPEAAEKLGLYCMTREMLEAAGYRAIGMDHFALAHDPLARAYAEGTIHRNFQGYTLRLANDLVGLGLSAIGGVGAAYGQNHHKLRPYYEAIRAGELPTVRGVALDEEDLLIRDAIKRVMCRFELDLDAFGAEHGIDAPAWFAREWEALDPLIEEGLVVREGHRMTATELGKLFVRNVAVVFDRRLRRLREQAKREGESGPARRFSRAI